jgi:hypothetical protein
VRRLLLLMQVAVLKKTKLLEKKQRVSLRGPSPSLERQQQQQTVI